MTCRAALGNGDLIRVVNDMFEFLNLCVHPLNLPLTLLGMAVVTYWGLFIVGVAGIDLFDVDVDLLPDADMRVSADVDADVELTVDGDVDVSGDSVDELTARHTPGTSFSWAAVLRFWHIGELPLTVVASLLVVSIWALNMIANYYFNPSLAWLWGVVLYLPVIGVSLLTTKVMAWPVSAIVRRIPGGTAARTRFVGRTCVVTTSEVNTAFGQARLLEDGTPIIINVRCVGDQRLTRGEEAVIVRHDYDHHTFQVVGLKLSDDHHSPREITL